MIRALYLVKYPEGVSPKEVEEFFLGIHMREQRSVPGLRRYLSYRNELPSDAWVMSGARYDRMIELWFDDIAAYERYRAGRRSFTLAPWTTKDAAGSGSGTFAEIAGIMVSEQPEWNLGEMS